jgi:hypothetical protein
VNKASLRSAVYVATKRLVARGLIAKGSPGGPNHARRRRASWGGSAAPPAETALLVAQRDELLRKARALDAEIEALARAHGPYGSDF